MPGAIHIAMLLSIASSSSSTDLPSWFHGPDSKKVGSMSNGEPIFKVGLFDTKDTIHIALDGRFSVWYPRDTKGRDVSHIEISSKTQLKIHPRELPKVKRVRLFPASATRERPEFRIGWLLQTPLGSLKHQQGYRWVRNNSGQSEAPDGSARRGQIYHPKRFPSYPVRFSIELASGARLAAFRWVLIVPNDMRAPGATLRSGKNRVQPRGAVLILRDTQDAVTAVALTPSESIVRGVVPAELFASAPSTALEAQAVAARTALWAMAGHRHFDRAYHVCASVHCQVYGGVKREQPTTDEATRATRGNVLIDAQGALVDAVFSSSCGGHTEANHHVWGGKAKPYLSGVSDLREHHQGITPKETHAWVNTPVHSYCTNHRFSSEKYFRWKRVFGQGKLWKLASETFPELRLITGVEVLERGVSGRVSLLRITGLGGRSRTIGPELAIRRAFGGLPSAAFEVSQRNDPQGAVSELEFRGAGFGHGVGMCQMGAIGRALEGQTADRILGHYYPGTTLKRLHR